MRIGLRNPFPSNNPSSDSASIDAEKGENRSAWRPLLDLLVFFHFAVADVDDAVQGIQLSGFALLQERLHRLARMEQLRQGLAQIAFMLGGKPGKNLIAFFVQLNLAAAPT